MNIDNHSARYLTFPSGETIRAVIQTQGRGTLAQLHLGEAVEAEVRRPHELMFRMPKSSPILIELATAGVTSAEELSKGDNIILLDVTSNSHKEHHRIAVEGPSRWTYWLQPADDHDIRLRHAMAGPMPSWYVCSNAPPCKRKPDRTGPEGRCKICTVGHVVHI